jgi:hypothetical protein
MLIMCRCVTYIAGFILFRINLLLLLKGSGRCPRGDRLHINLAVVFENLSYANDPDESGEVANGVLHHVDFQSPFRYQFSDRQRFGACYFLNDSPINLLQSKTGRESVDSDGPQPRFCKLGIKVAIPCVAHVAAHAESMGSHGVAELMPENRRCVIEKRLRRFEAKVASVMMKLIQLGGPSILSPHGRDGYYRYKTTPDDRAYFFEIIGFCTVRRR